MGVGAFFRLERSAEMASKHHTIILVPHARARFRKYRVTSFQIGLTLTALLLLTAAAAFTTWSYFTSPVDERALAAMRLENTRLREVNQAFEGSIDKLQLQLSDYEERTRKLAIVAGIETSADVAGVGGTTTLSTPGALAGIDSRALLLGEDLDRIERRLEERHRLLSATPAIAPVKGLLTSFFGTRRDPITGRRESHPAIDIAASPGKPVLATADGFVTQAGSSGDGLGIAVFVSHGYGMTTRYGHLSRVAVTSGQPVHRGDVIGFVGSTGRSTGYHLHYEVLVDGRPVNPLGYILDGASGG